MSELTVVSNDLAGSVKIADEVITNIAASATLEVKGVAGISRQLANDIAGKFGRRNSKKIKDLQKYQKGITLQVDGNVLKLSVAIVIHRNAKIPKVAQEVQAKIKNAVETMTGLTTEIVNIHVAGLVA
ncbi:MAG: Asp23/Gls24 family envelope stress response protein [Firmicutes bacterium]|nr:Asp23/Gls24 family envelope stress response protein [Bacillota bacterium]